jgi:hypothetical protein
LLYALIPALWLALVVLALMVFRLAARSDADQAAALAEWMQAGDRAEREVFTGQGHADGLAQAASHEQFRAMG